MTSIEVVLSWPLSWGMAVAAVLGLLTAAALTTGGGPRWSPTVVVLAVLAGIAASGDVFARWLLERNTTPEPTPAMLSALVEPLGPAWTVALTTPVLLGIAVHTVLISVSAVLVLLLAWMLPLTAVLDFREWRARIPATVGRWSERLIPQTPPLTRTTTLSWAVAVVLHKPVAVVFYVAALQIQEQATTLIGSLSSLVLIAFSVATLPALTRLASAVVESVTPPSGPSATGNANEA